MTKRIVPMVLSSLFGGLVGGAVVMCTVQRGTVLPAAAGERDDVSGPASRADWERRLRVLEEAAEVNRDAVPGRVVHDAAPDSSERARLESLTRQVADLREQLGLTAPLAEGEDARRLLDTLDRLRPRGGGDAAAEVLRARARVPLRVRFLERWAGHARAERELAGLVDDLVLAGESARAARELERLGPGTGIAAWRLDVLRLRAAGPSSEAVHIAQRVGASPADERTKAWAMRRMGDVLEAMGERERAMQVFEALRERFATCSGARRHVSWARDRLEVLAKRR